MEPASKERLHKAYWPGCVFWVAAVSFTGCLRCHRCWGTGRNVIPWSSSQSVFAAQAHTLVWQAWIL